MVMDRKNRENALDSFLAAEILRRRSQYRTIHLLSQPSRPRVGIRVLIVVSVGFLIFFSGSHLLPIILLESSCSGLNIGINNATGQRSIAVIDQIADKYPDQGFVDNVSSTAHAAGYRFDYYLPEKATVDFFVNLPNYGYSIIVLRDHGTGLVAQDPAALVTSEHYSESQHVADQLLDRVTTVNVDGTRLFALGEGFVSGAMCGHFSGTLILAMFCKGAYVPLARAFLEKGAGAYIAWDELVTVGQTDLAFESLVNLLLKGNPPDSSVQNVMTTVGPDPVTGARLMSYSQSSLPIDANTLQHCWYIISIAMAAAIVGLSRKTSTPRPKNQ